MVTVSKRLRPADHQMCNIILDFKEQKIEKCVVEGARVDRDWVVLTEYYRKVYPALITQLEKDGPLAK